MSETLISQYIPLEMRYRPTVAYEASELAPKTVYIDANGRMGTANLPEHLRHMVDPRQVDSFNPDFNSQGTNLVNAALALNGAAPPTVVRKIDGVTTRVVFPNHERTSALPHNRRMIEAIRQTRQNNAPIQTATLSDLNEAFEAGRSGLSDTAARNLKARFVKRPDAVKGMAAVSRARKASESIDPTTGIKTEALNRMNPAMRRRLTEVKTNHSGARAPILFHPKKTGYKTPSMPGYTGPTRPDLKPDARVQAFGAMVPGTSQQAFNDARGSVFDRLPGSTTAKGQGSKKLKDTVQKNTKAATSMADSLTQQDEAARAAALAAAAAEANKKLSAARDQTITQDGTVSYTTDDATKKSMPSRGGYTTDDGGYTTDDEYYPAEMGSTGKCGWKCWLLAALTAVAAGGGIYALAKK